MSTPSGQKRRIRKEPDVTSGSSSSTSAIVVEDSDDTEADTEVRACPSTSAQVLLPFFVTFTLHFLNADVRLKVLNHECFYNIFFLSEHS